MSIRNIVKVMNFHALIRVDYAKKRADKYSLMEQQLFSMMSVIANNRNMILDQRILKPDPNAPEINIYIGSDFGFCSNFNSQMSDRLARDDARNHKIIIGKKLISRRVENAVYRMTGEELDEKLPEIEEYLEQQIQDRACSKIHLIYNHYQNTTTIYARKLQIYPVERITEEQRQQKHSKEDFAMEGDAAQLLSRMLAAYIHYELLLAVVSSRASENILRQNATTESLKKIDEMEEEALMEARREKANKEFQKVVDNFTKTKVY